MAFWFKYISQVDTLCYFEDYRKAPYLSDVIFIIWSQTNWYTSAEGVSAVWLLLIQDLMTQSVMFMCDSLSNVIEVLYRSSYEKQPPLSIQCAYVR